ncbi:MAG: MGMT family protein [Candidatus Omnitrophica bacterium]|nr:MGMT family protein [Candidatus Omnitrophota bacterium]MDD5574272.1 MGMT family protein [Candidatus Omnitrophota bacterium]
MRHRLTPFQKAVYAATMEIPLGETRSYAWVARRIGRPRSYRAVGNALNKNPYAPFVPCHRVIASDGTPGGFNGGLAKKLRLLDQERKFGRAGN